MQTCRRLPNGFPNSGLAFYVEQGGTLHDAAGTSIEGCSAWSRCFTVLTPQCIRSAVDSLTAWGRFKHPLRDRWKDRPFYHWTAVLAF